MIGGLCKCLCWDVLYSETSKESLDRRVVFEMLLKKCKNEIAPLLCLNRWESWLCPYICINITHYLLMKFSSFCSLCEVEISVLLLYFKITSFQIERQWKWRHGKLLSVFWLQDHSSSSQSLSSTPSMRSWGFSNLWILEVPYFGW